MGSGSFCTVLLARHQDLEVYRAIKILPKSDAPSISALSEVHMLTALHHPGIPDVYDFYEDDQAYYLIEEYIPGESLAELLDQQQVISQAQFYRYALELCEIFQYLHSCKPVPILYLDLKPEHIKVCGSQLKLIDFGVSIFCNPQGISSNIYGNREYSAPELLEGGLPTFSSDIYSIGRILEYLSNHTDPPLPRNLLPIIQKSCNADPNFRFETAKDLGDAIRQFQIGQTHLSTSVAAVGCHSGCGTTTVSIALTSAWNRQGRDAFYIESNLSGALRNAISYLPITDETRGCYHYHTFRGYPEYGPGIRLDSIESGITIHDFGTCPSFSLLREFDLVLLICDATPWHQEGLDALLSRLSALPGNLLVVGNRCSFSEAAALARRLHRPVYRVESLANPFQPDKRFLQLARTIDSQLANRNR